MTFMVVDKAFRIVRTVFIPTVSPPKPKSDDSRRFCLIMKAANAR
jgi:hypothetical protein